jgi:hypothetical protein
MTAGLTLRNLLGPNFLFRIPPHTTIDLANGVLEFPGPSFARYIRTPQSRLWHAVDGYDEPPMVVVN